MMVAFVGTILFLFKRDKGYPQVVFHILLFTLFLYYFADGCYMIPGVGYKVFLIANLVSEYVTACLPVLVLLYIRFAYKDMTSISRMVIYFIPAFTLGLGCSIIFGVGGMDQSMEYMRAFETNDPEVMSTPLFKLSVRWFFTYYMALMSAECVILLIFMIVWAHKYHISLAGYLRFIFKKGAYPVENILFYTMVGFLLVSLVRISLNRLFFINHPYWSAALSFIIAFLMAFCIFFAFVPKIKDLTVRKLFTQKIVIQPDPQMLVSSDIPLENIKRYQIKKMSFASDSERIYMLLIRNRYYCDPRASLADASERLGISKYRINKIVATNCYCSFETLLETCRQTLHSED